MRLIVAAVMLVNTFSPVMRHVYLVCQVNSALVAVMIRSPAQRGSFLLLTGHLNALLVLMAFIVSPRDPRTVPHVQGGTSVLTRRLYLNRASLVSTVFHFHLAAQLVHPGLTVYLRDHRLAQYVHRASHVLTLIQALFSVQSVAILLVTLQLARHVQLDILAHQLL